MELTKHSGKRPSPLTKSHRISPVVILVANRYTWKLNMIHIVHFDGHVTLVLKVNRNSAADLSDE